MKGKVASHHQTESHSALAAGPPMSPLKQDIHIDIHTHTLILTPLGDLLPAQMFILLYKILSMSSFIDTLHNEHVVYYALYQ